MKFRLQILFISLLFSGFLSSCSKNYFQQTQVSPAFSKTTRYKTILLKPTLVSSQGLATEEVINRCAFHLRAEMSKLNFDIMGGEKFEEACRARSFGGSGTVSESVALEAAKSLGAQAIAYSEISTESIKGGLPLMATIRILNTADGSQLYTGKARADNPVSLEAGLEFALEKALEGLK
jgi:hypothetical protein